VQPHILGGVGSLAIIRLQIFQKVCQWKNFENPLTMMYGGKCIEYLFLLGTASTVRHWLRAGFFMSKLTS